MTDTERDDLDRAEYRKRSRSPSYPALGLAQAVSRAAKVYERERRNWAPVDAVVRHWGYTTQSGTALVTIAALKKFGLLIEDGAGLERRVRLSDLGVKLLLLDEREHASERKALTREAALKPGIHGQLWKRYGSELPSDSTLRYVLLTEFGFTERAVKEFIPQYRATIAWAGLLVPEIPAEETNAEAADGDLRDDRKPVVHNGGSQPAQGVDAVPAPDAASVPAGLRAVTLPLPGEVWAVLHVPVPMTEEGWEHMMTILKAMKPAIVGTRRDVIDDPFR